MKKQFYSFKNAVNGLFWAVKTQLNFRVHLFLSSLAIVAGLVLNISQLEFLIVFILIGIGLAIELLNTSIEEAIDAIHKNWSDEIKIAKDTSAAAMLIFAVSAAIIACLIFIPRVIKLLNFNF
ncbi:hypothetical protein A2774_03920 [Candidatus Roizmanbacteria bacterium RIFCSPHIGHO2_01_FULL_39_12c]|uniref:Diacylglycerol kinase n=1 Tax=Candidatus Roizmanbacteria bacterium RIFCSPHIGHO2_01_FULL_39_12c TaxID=1802031 RepID=A0A1F7GEQ8_9BACT|nr:MAG: hypothetical protein A2774_03920 [Candidatus Roizmanbacteria bacterium RIFCSPHIGHO2_01_FULL_39_12c]OGK48109.1 MAG: hypothetical protein A2963_03735 [Candidatus Roizmanbacteria bacterium RIFCSPLOWO2_01_FULL_40_13]